MSQGEGGLLGFLKKNAAFSNGGTPSSHRNSDFKSGNYVQNNHSFNESHRNPNQYQAGNRRDNSYEDNKSSLTFGNQTNYGYSGGNYQGRGNGRFQDDRQSISSFQSDSGSIRTTTTSFESARGEAESCLNNLSEVIKSNIHEIDRKMDSFNQDILKQLKDHSDLFRKKIVFMIDEVFR